MCGGDLEPQTLVTAYATGLFPMPVRRRTMGWWSPDPRGVLPIDGLVVSRSLRRSMRRFEIRVDRLLRGARVTHGAFFDPAGERMRS